MPDDVPDQFPVVSEHTPPHSETPRKEKGRTILPYVSILKKSVVSIQKT